MHGVGATGGEPKSFEASLDGPVEYRTYRRLMALFRRADALVFGGVLLLALVASLMEVVGVGAVPVLVAALAVPERLLEYPIAQRIVGLLGIETDRELVLWGSIGLLVVYVVKNSLLGVIYYVQTWVVERYRVGLADELFSAYMRAPLEFHLQRNSSELLRNVQLETREIVIGVIAPFMNVVMGGLMTVLIVALLAWTAPLTTLLAVGIVGGGSWAFVHLFKGRLHRLGLEAQKQRHVSVQAVLQGLGGLVPARLLGKEGFFLEEHRRSIKRAVRAIRTNSFINKLTGPVLELVAVVGVVSIVLLTLASGSDLPSIMPLLALFGAAIVRLRATVSQVVGGVNRIRFGIVAANPLYEDMLALGALGSGSEELALGTESPVERLPYDSELRLENVTYTYPGGNGPALKNVTAAISCGSSVAFVGATGSGKTTLLNVILGLLRPQEGSVTVDGRRVDEATAAWQRNLGYIPQSIFLLDDTLRRNVAFGTADAAIDEDALNEALEIAQLADFVASLADGLDTRVGEQGVRLSGGQRQRIGIARALYTRPAVLVLDEATSSLDNETEDLVMRALDHARRDRTVIMVAHRLSTVQGCDVLHYMSDGQIEASGTYESLLSGHPGFRQMVSTGSGA